MFYQLLKYYGPFIIMGAALFFVIDGGFFEAFMCFGFAAVLLQLNSIDEVIEDVLDKVFDKMDEL